MIIRNMFILHKKKRNVIFLTCIKLSDLSLIESKNFINY